MRPLRTVCAIAAATAFATVAVTACSAPTRPATSASGPASYYLALGDSLAQGVQPDSAGSSVETRQGYPDQLYAVLRRTRPALQLVQLGCPGETTKTMINGGICRYPGSGGSQLAAAVAFLRAHRGHVFLVTLDIGANDPEDCANQPGLATLASCVRSMPEAAANLTTILTRLRAAAGPGVRIVGMSYYLPALAEWRNGLFGRSVAWLSERLAVSYDDLLMHAYSAANVQVANVFGAFDTTDFGDQVSLPGVGTVPRNVAQICQWTWECAAPPRGPNQHANQAGYAVIAQAFLRAAALS